MTNTEKKTKQLTIVLGMHRSGTSVITRSLKVFDIDLGNNLMPEADGNNAKGFWEDLDINNLNINLLKAIGHDWHTLLPITNEELNSITAQSFMLPAVEILRSKLNEHSHFGIKDPRMCRLLPFWQRIFKHLDLEVNYIIACRNPMSVARSLHKRDGFELEKSYYLWLDHMLESISNTRKENRVIIDYDLLMENPTKQLDRIAHCLKINLDQESDNLKNYNKSFLEDNLRSTQFKEKDLLLELSAPKNATALYQLLLRLAKDDQDIDNDSFTKEVERIRLSYNQNLPAMQYIDKLESSVTEKNNLHIELNNIISKQLSEKENLNIELHKQKKIIDKQYLIENTQKETISRQEQEKLELINIIHEKDNIITIINSDIHELRQSTSWRVSQPLRTLGSFQIKNKLKILVKSIQMGGGLSSTVKKSLHIYKKEGLEGIKARLFVASHHLNHANKKISEKNSTHSKNTSNIQKTNWLEETKKIDISEYDIISFDIFDTAIIRLFESPTDIFSHIEKNKKIKDFRSKRIQSEQQAREKNSHKKDVTLHDIYQTLEHSIDIELEAELLLTAANPVIYDLYNRAKSANKKIIFVSDMYLTDVHIEKILTKNGYTTYDKLYVSSMDDLPKGDGSRFVDLKKVLGEQKILHIGDNTLADYEWPKRHGIDSIKYHDPEEFFRNDALLASLYDDIKKQDSVSLSFLLGLYRNWTYGEKSEGWSIWRDIGFIFGGPLIHSFTHYISDACTQDQPVDLYFLARDGMIIKAVYDELFKKPNQSTSYLLASRRAMTFPLFSMEQEACKNSTLLDLYSAIHEASTAEEVFERLAYPELKEILDNLKVSAKNNSILNKKSILKVLDKNHSVLSLKAQQEYNGMLEYLNQEDFFKSNATLVDVGWNGTIQDCLSKISELSSENKNHCINGIYLGIVPTARNTVNKKGFIFDSNNSELYKETAPFLDFIELLTSAPTHSLDKFISKAPFVSFTQPSQEEKNRFEISKEIQHGIIDYTKSIKKTGTEESPMLSSKEISTLFNILKTNASPEITAVFNSIKHSRMPSESYIHSIINFESKNA